MTHCLISVAIKTHGTWKVRDTFSRVQEQPLQFDNSTISTNPKIPLPFDSSTYQTWTFSRFIYEVSVRTQRTHPHVPTIRYMENVLGMVTCDCRLVRDRQAASQPARSPTRAALACPYFVRLIIDRETTPCLAGGSGGSALPGSGGHERSR